MSVYAVLACLPATVPEVCRHTDMEPGEVLAAIQEARADGHIINATPDPTVKNVPPRAQPGPDFLSTVYDVVSQ